MKRLADERVKGIDCYALTLTLDLEKLSGTTLIQPGTTELFERLGVDPKMFQDISLKHFYSKKTFFPIKSEMRVSVVVDAETMPQRKGKEYEMHMEITSEGIYRNFNEPVSIELPVEAKGAEEGELPF